MADDRNNPVVGYPTREIRVTGERCASMVHTTVAVSRFEIQLVNMSMSSASGMREAVRKSSDRFKRALDAFEAELRECQRDLDLASKRKRPANRKPSKGNGQRPAQDQTTSPEAKQQSSAAAQNTPATKPKHNKGEQNQQSKKATTQNQPTKSADAQQNAGAKPEQKQAQKPAKQRAEAVPDASTEQSKAATPATSTEQRPAVTQDAAAEQKPTASPAEPTPSTESAVPVL